MKQINGDNCQPPPLDPLDLNGKIPLQIAKKIRRAKSFNSSPGFITLWFKMNDNQFNLVEEL